MQAECAAYREHGSRGVRCDSRRVFRPIKTVLECVMPSLQLAEVSGHEHV